MGVQSAPIIVMPLKQPEEAELKPPKKIRVLAEAHAESSALGNC